MKPFQNKQDSTSSILSKLAQEIAAQQEELAQTQEAAAIAQTAVQTAQTALATKQAELQRLEAEEAERQREAALDLEIQEFRQFADGVNEASKELVKALAAFEEQFQGLSSRAKKRIRFDYGPRQPDRPDSIHPLATDIARAHVPLVAHKRGVDAFVVSNLSAPSKTPLVLEKKKEITAK